MQLEISSKCNAICSMCRENFSGGQRSQGLLMGLRQFRMIIDELESYKTDEIVLANRLHFVGSLLPYDKVSDDEVAQILKGKILLKIVGFGEPLLNRDLPEMLSWLKDKDFCTELVTNCSLLDASYAKKILKAGSLEVIGVSIDSHIKEVYEIIRAGLSFSVVMDNLHSLLELAGVARHRPRIVVLCVELKENRAHLESMRHFFTSRGFGFQVVRDLRKNRDMPPDYLCPKLGHSIAVHANLDVVACCYDNMLETCIGNLQNQSLLDIWLHEKHLGLMMLNQKRMLGQLNVCSTRCIRS